MSVLYVEDMTIDLGEKIHVRSIVKPKCEQDLPFTIRNARYELIYGTEVEESGECTINEHEIDAFIHPEKAGTYYLKYIYDIADETWVDKVRIKVG